MPIESSPRSIDSRIGAVDVARGLVMALMTLDHARDYLVSGNVAPTDLEQTNVVLFLTRWVTHFCAPGFVLLAGISVYLSGKRRDLPKPVIARQLLVRGAWLIAIDVVVMPLLWWFNFDYSLLPLGVLWAIGWSMIAFACFIALPIRWIAMIGVAMILLHNCFDGIRFAPGTTPDWIWCVLHVQAGLRLWDGFVVITAYPLVPWIGVLMLGYGLGSVISKPLSDRRKFLLWIGTILIFAFVLIRYANIYGDPSPWKPQGNATFTFLSFLNCTKYPPSLSFLLMTLGPILVLLSLLGDKETLWKRPFVILGRSPLFYYLLHVLVVHGVAVVFSLLKYGRAEWWFRNPPFVGIPEDYGWSLYVLYAVWIVVVAALVPVCYAHQQWKLRTSNEAAE